MSRCVVSRQGVAAALSRLDGARKPAAWELEVLKYPLLGGSEVSFYGSSGFWCFSTIHNDLS